MWLSNLTNDLGKVICCFIPQGDFFLISWNLREKSRRYWLEKCDGQTDAQADIHGMFIELFATAKNIKTKWLKLILWLQESYIITCLLGCVSINWSPGINFPLHGMFVPGKHTAMATTLTQGGFSKMADILQMTFSSALSWICSLAVWYKTKFGSQNFGYQLWCLFCNTCNVLKNMFNVGLIIMW